MGSDWSSNSYYRILGVTADSSDKDIRRAYRKLAMQWHPDKWTRDPSLLGKSKRKFQQIQEAYSVLSDKRKRTIYDAGLYDPNEEDNEGFSDFLQEMISLMDEVRREEKNYTMEDLRGMFMEMAKDFDYSSRCQWAPFEYSEWGFEPLMFDGHTRSSKKARCNPNPVPRKGSHSHVSDFGIFATNQFCT